MGILDQNTVIILKVKFIFSCIYPYCTSRTFLCPFLFFLHIPPIILMKLPRFFSFLSLNFAVWVSSPSIRLSTRIYFSKQNLLPTFSSPSTVTNQSFIPLRQHLRKKLCIKELQLIQTPRDKLSKQCIEQGTSNNTHVTSRLVSDALLKCQFWILFTLSKSRI